ncbi:MAG: hypothetical protein JSR77_00925 [Planctomycetes bacterium]|nr:hypothetical protein [Planctomycetota bacterium]
MKTRSDAFGQVCAISALLVAAASTAHGIVTYNAIALTGTDGVWGPGMGAGVTFQNIGQQQPTINSYGKVVFRATTSAAGNPQGVFLHSSGGNANVAIAGGSRPGGGTYPTGSDGIFNSTCVNDSGDWAFRVGASTGLFASSGGVPGRTMLTGDAAPDTGGATYSSVASGTPLFNSAGQSGYVGNLTVGTGSPAVVISGATANSAGVWVGTPGNVHLALRQNDSVLSLDAGGAVRVGTLQASSMAINGSGRYVITTALQGTVTTGNGAGSNASMIATNRNGSLEVIARVGNAAPDANGVPSATDIYRNFSTSSIGFNDAGRIVFSSSIRNAAGTQTATGALFSDTIGGTMRLLAKSGNAMPTIYSGSGAALSEFNGLNWGFGFSNTMINGAGTIITNAGLANTGASNNTNAVLLMDSSGIFTKVVRDNDVAIVNGAPLGGDAFFNSISSVQLNNAGQVAFNATLRGNGVSAGLGNGSVLFGWDRTLGLQLIARTGDSFEVSPGVFRTISTIGGLANSGGQDGRLGNLNNYGLLAFELDFSDGSSGIFTAAIPEPGVMSAFGILAIASGRRRRR